MDQLREMQKLVDLEYPSDWQRCQLILQHYGCVAWGVAGNGGYCFQGIDHVKAMGLMDELMVCLANAIDHKGLLLWVLYEREHWVFVRWSVKA